MIVAESEKQQELSIKESEKARLQESLNSSQRENNHFRVAIERAKREAAARQEQDREAINRLTGEIKNFKSQFATTVESHEAEISQMNEKIGTLCNERDQIDKEAEELKPFLIILI